MLKAAALVLLAQITIAAVAAPEGSPTRKWEPLPASEASDVRLAQKLAGTRLADAESALNRRLEVVAMGWDSEHLNKLRAEQEDWYKSREQTCDAMKSREKFLEVAVVVSLECKTNMTLERTRDVGARWGG